MDKRAASCFPDLEKVAVPSQIVPKAGVSIQKRMSKLDSLKCELDDITRKQSSAKAKVQKPAEAAVTLPGRANRLLNANRPLNANRLLSAWSKEDG